MAEKDGKVHILLNISSPVNLKASVYQNLKTAAMHADQCSQFEHAVRYMFSCNTQSVEPFTSSHNRKSFIFKDL